MILDISELKALVESYLLTVDKEDHWDEGHFSDYGGAGGVLDEFIEWCQVAEKDAEDKSPVLILFRLTVEQMTKLQARSVEIVGDDNLLKLLLFIIENGEIE